MLPPLWPFACPVQMDLDAAALTQLQQWLDTAAPAQRCYFLTRLGRLPPRPLGAQLFAALLAGGRTADALRLLRHAGALADGEVERLAREHLVEGQVGWGSGCPNFVQDGQGLLCGEDCPRLHALACRS